MAQSIFGGVNSYQERSLNGILEDIITWIEYTEKTRDLIFLNNNKLRNLAFGDRIPLGFKSLIVCTLDYFSTIIADLRLVEKGIVNNFITAKEVSLLEKIGVNAAEYNRKYGNIYHREEIRWKDDEYLDFKLVEEIYNEGRTYFVTLQDAEAAAFRMEDYMNDNTIHNSVIFNSSVQDIKIQQGNVNTMSLGAIEISKLEQLIENLKNTVTNSFTNETIREINDNIAVIKYELSNQNPNKGIIQKALYFLKAISNSVQFFNMVSEIEQFVTTYIS